jgi:hypothetical protein
LFSESLEKLIETSELLGLNLYESFLTLDSGFDSEDNKLIIEWHNLKPVIKPNRRGTKDQERLTEMYENFNEEIYKERFKIERTFAWQDTYRKLVIRYEKLECTHLGFKHLAYTMINLRQMLNGGNLI